MLPLLGCDQTTVITCSNCSTSPTPPLTQKTHHTGWDDPPGTGHVFVIDEIKIAESPDIGFPGPDGKIHNILAPIGQLWNDQLRQGLLGGEDLMLIEIAGIDEPFAGDDDEVTLKFYRALDADAPFYPANNFMIPMGETSCCQFLINLDSLAGAPPQARSRIPAKIVGGQLTGPIVDPFAPAQAPVELPGVFLLATSTISEGVALAFPQISLRVSSDIDSPPPVPRLHDGLLGGAMTIHSLAQLKSTFCKADESDCFALFTQGTWLDYLAQTTQPDTDVDGDGGLDRLQTAVTGSAGVGLCYGGHGALIPPLFPERPASCALQPQMGDGFSISLELEAVGAEVLGFAN
jgi:hypothetical protein